MLLIIFVVDCWSALILCMPLCWERDPAWTLHFRWKQTSVEQAGIQNLRREVSEGSVDNNLRWLSDPLSGRYEWALYDDYQIGICFNPEKVNVGETLDLRYRLWNLLILGMVIFLNSRLVEQFCFHFLILFANFLLLPHINIKIYEWPVYFFCSYWII